MNPAVKLCEDAECVGLSPVVAGSEVTLRGTVTNTGNVKLQNVVMRPVQRIDASPMCTVGPADGTGDTTEHVDDVVPVGYQAVCTVVYAIGQDALETIVTSSSGAPEVHLQLAANATATQAATLLTQTASVVVPVTQTASISVTISTDQCQVPQEPGKWGQLVGFCRSMHGTEGVSCTN
jgi:hypothetical protein